MALRLFFLSIFLSLPLDATVVFERTYGGEDDDWGNSVCQTWDGGYVIGGETMSFGAGDLDFYLIRTDSLGDTLWTRTYGGPYWDLGRSIRETGDGGYIFAGFTQSFGVGTPEFCNVYLLRLDPNGDTIWTRTYGGEKHDWANWVEEISTGGYVVSGWTWSFGEGGFDVYLLKIDPLGDTVWTKTYGGPGFDRGCSVEESDERGFVIAGWTTSFGSGLSDVFLIRTDSDGDTLWTRTYGGPGRDGAYSIERTPDGRYIVVGYTESFGAGSRDFYVLKVDQDGDTLWTSTYGGVGWDCAFSVAITEDGDYLITGETKSFGVGTPDFSNVYMVKVDSSGHFIWSKIYGGDENDIGLSSELTSDGGFVIAGETHSFGAGEGDIYLIKTDREGDVLGPNEGPKGGHKDPLRLKVYPNPSHSFVKICFLLDRETDLRLSIYDTRGELVRTLINGKGKRGLYSFLWNGKDELGRGRKSGIYFVKLFSREKGPIVGKFLLMR